MRCGPGRTRLYGLSGGPSTPTRDIRGYPGPASNRTEAVVAGGASSSVALVWDGRLDYNFGPTHPLQPVRVELTVELIRALGLVDGVAVEMPAGEYDEEELERVHRREYIDAVRRLGTADSPGAGAFEFGLGPGDNPAFPGMHQASMRVCAASRQAARLVWEGTAIHAFNPAGGLHHAMPDRASGFCIYNDPAVAIDWLLDNGAERVGYLDVDVHHGDGVQAIFYDDPRVLTISLHESGRYLFPGTGFPDEHGGPGAEGTAANLPLAPGTPGSVWLEVFDAAVEPLLRAWQPDVLVTQLGCDSHVRDPLAHLALTVDDYAQMAGRVHGLAHDVAGGRWVATGGGGYRLVDVVPRAWSVWFAQQCGIALPDALPEQWQQTARSRQAGPVPDSFRDPTVEVREETAATARRAAAEAVEGLATHVFAHHGIRPPRL